MGAVQRWLGRKRKGFTLIELMVVVTIIGILAAMAIPRLTGAADSAKTARIKADLSTIGSAVELYYADNGKYPTDLNVLVDNSANGKGYLRAVPDAPGDVKTYEYTTSNGEVTYTFKGVTYSSFGTATGPKI